MESQQQPSPSAPIDLTQVSSGTPVRILLSRDQALDLRFALRDAANGARGAALMMAGRFEFGAADALRNDAARYHSLALHIQQFIDAIDCAPRGDGNACL